MDLIRSLHILSQLSKSQLNAGVVFIAVNTPRWIWQHLAHSCDFYLQSYMDFSFYFLKMSLYLFTKTVLKMQTQQQTFPGQQT